MERWWETSYLCPFRSLFRLTKGEISHCAAEDSGKQRLDQMLKLASPLISHVNILHSSTGWTKKGREIAHGICGVPVKGGSFLQCFIILTFFRAQVISKWSEIESGLVVLSPAFLVHKVFLHLKRVLLKMESRALHRQVLQHQTMSPGAGAFQANPPPLSHTSSSTLMHSEQVLYRWVMFPDLKDVGNASWSHASQHQPPVTSLPGPEM